MKPPLAISSLLLACAATLLAVASCADPSPEIEALQAETAYQRGIDHRAQGELRNAFDAFNQALQLAPDHARAYAARASIYYAFDETQNTIADLNAALRLDPDIAEAYHYRARIFADRGDPDNAIINFTRRPPT